MKKNKNTEPLTQQMLSAAERDRFFSLSLDIICIAGGDGYFKWVNSTFADVLGWTVDELLTSPLIDFIHPDDVVSTNRAIESMVKEGKNLFHFENRYRHKDGSWLTLSWKASPEGALMYAIGRDVTERNRLAQALKQANADLEQGVVSRTAALQDEVSERKKAEHNMRDLLEASPDAIIMVDQNDCISLASGRVKTMFGYSPEEIVGSPINMLLPEGNLDLQTFASRDMSNRKELIGIRNDGSKFPVEVAVSTDHIADGLATIAVVRDVSDHKAIETQLLHAQKMEAIGNLTGGLAHDFNNLLGVIIGNLDLLGDEKFVNAESGMLVNEALEAALRGADLTQRLLAFARRQPLQPKQIEVNDTIEKLGKLLHRTLGDDIELTFELETEAASIIVDPAQLESSLLNIINNARDAMPQGGNLVISTANQYLDKDNLESRPELAPGHYTMIELSDSGAGMPPEVVNQIYEPFFTTKEPDKGTGLGLSMVFGFIKQSNGHIYVYSEEGVGTTFRLYLPCSPEASKDLHDTQAENLPERGGRETILAVEDNSGLRRVVARQLKELGYRFLEAEDGPAALKILESEPVDLLFTDIVMPGGMSGHDLARTVAERWPAIKIVLTSGFTEVMSNASDEATMNARLLVKPYRKKELARILREALDS